MSSDLIPLGSNGGARLDKFDAFGGPGEGLLDDPDVVLPAFDGGVRLTAGNEFVCACDACELEGEEGEESDRRRTAIRRLFEDVGRCGKEPTLGMRKVRACASCRDLR